MEWLLEEKEGVATYDKGHLFPREQCVKRKRKQASV